MLNISEFKLLAIHNDWQIVIQSIFEPLVTTSRAWEIWVLFSAYRRFMVPSHKHPKPLLPTISLSSQIRAHFLLKLVSLFRIFPTTFYIGHKIELYMELSILFWKVIFLFFIKNSVLCFIFHILIFFRAKFIALSYIFEDRTVIYSKCLLRICQNSLCTSIRRLPSRCLSYASSRHLKTRKLNIVSIVPQKNFQPTTNPF